MPRFTTNQQRFTQGELDPDMLAREDIDQYFGALATAKKHPDTTTRRIS